MFALSFLFAAILPFVSAQSDSPALQVEGIEAHFTQAGIVPSLLPSFTPSALLTINYEGVGDLTPGQAVSQERNYPSSLPTRHLRILIVPQRSDPLLRSK